MYILRFLGLFLILSIYGNDKLFEVDFNDYGVNAGLAKGDAKGYEFKETDLQLRMFPGVNGKGNSVNLANSENIVYRMPGNLDPRQGTVSVWVSPQNWNINEPGRQMFFSAYQKDFYIRIMKNSDSYIQAAIYYKSPNDKDKPFSIGVAARVSPDDWSSGKWHKIDLAWDTRSIALYIDGKVPQKTPTSIGSRRVPPTAPHKNFPHEMTFPEASGSISVGMIADWQRNANTNREHKTAIDSVTVYSRPLSGQEILAEYEKIIPPAQVQENKPNFCRIPLQSGSIELDGKLDEEVWTKAARLPMRPMSSGPASDTAALAWHDGVKLYIAFATNAPCKIRKHHERDGKLWEDDSFEFHLQTADRQDYQFIINGNSAVFDQKNKQPGWNSSAKASASITPAGWTVEFAIPLEEVGGLEQLSAKGTYANFGYSRHNGLATNLSHWGSYRGKAYRPADEIILGGDAGFFRIDKIGDLDNGRLELNATGTEGSVSEAIITPHGYPPVKYPGNLAGQTWSRKLPVGRQTLEVTAADRNGSPLYYWQCRYDVSFPMELAHNNLPEQKKIEVEINLSNAGGKVLEQLTEKGISGTLSLAGPDGKQITVESFVLQKNPQKMLLPFPDQAVAGTYTIQAETTGTDTAFSRAIPFRIPDMAPYLATPNHSIPAPWTPVLNPEPGRYQVWGRIYEFGDSPFPVQIISGTDKLLHTAPEWQINGQPVQWEKPRTVESHPDYFKFKGAGRQPGLTINWSGELWFDGAYILNFTLNPDKAGKIEDFTIRYRVAKPFDRNVMDPIHVPWKEGRAEIGLEGDARRKDNVVWVAGVEKGVFFWVKSNANWVNRKNEKPMVVTQEKDGALVELRIISTAAELKTNADYTMAFMGTPARAMGTDARSVNYGGYGRGPATHQSIGWTQFHDRAADDDMTSLNSATPAYPERFEKEVVGRYAAKGIKLHIYSMPGQLSNVEPDYDYFGLNNLSVPRLQHFGVKLGTPWIVDRFCLNATGLPGDLWSYKIADTMKRFPQVAGYYFDVAATKYCESKVHGCGGVDAFGQPYTSSDALGLRRFLMQVYKTVTSHGGSIMLHAHIQFMPLSHNFINYFLPGENAFHMMVNNLEYGYCDNFTQELYETDMNQRKAGVPYHVLFQTGRVCRLMPAYKKDQKRIEGEPEYAIRAMTPMVVHDLNFCPDFVQKQTVFKFWNIRKQINLAQAKAYHGYWESDAVKSGSPKLYCGWYEWETSSPYSRVLVVANFNRETMPAKLILDKKALNIGPDAVFHDIWNDKPLTEADLPAISVNGNHFLLIGVK